MSNKVTDKKRNRYKIRGRIQQAILKSFTVSEIQSGFYGLSRPEIVRIANRAANAVMLESKIEVIAKRSK